MKWETKQVDAAILLLLFANLISFLQHGSGGIVSQQKTQTSTITGDEKRERLRNVVANERHDKKQMAMPTRLQSDHRRDSHLFQPMTMNSSWIGNMWIPPTTGTSVDYYRLYSPSEFRTYFAHHSILFVGDSTARRTYATLYAILNSSSSNDDDEYEEIPFWDLDNPAVIDINKKGTTEPCHKPGLALCRFLPQQKQIAEDAASSLISLDSSSSANSTRLFDLMGGRCPSDVEALAKSSFQNRINDYTLIVISMGAAELNDMCEIVSSTKKSKKKKPLRDYLSAIRELLQLPKRSNATIVWRTMGNIGWNDNQQGLISLHKAQYRNSRIVNRIQQQERQQQITISSSSSSPSPEGSQSHGRVTVVDWGKAIEPRSFPFRDRIVGDIPPHYGLEARLVFLQMLLNHLIQSDGYYRRGPSYE